MFRDLRSSGSRSICGENNQSISPLISALAAVAVSGITCHSTRSICTILPPAVHSAGSSRGT